MANFLTAEQYPSPLLLCSCHSLRVCATPGLNNKSATSLPLHSARGIGLSNFQAPFFPPRFPSPRGIVVDGGRGRNNIKGGGGACSAWMRERQQGRRERGRLRIETAIWETRRRQTFSPPPPSPPTATTRERTNVGVMERKEATTPKINHLIPSNEASSSSATISKQGYTCSFPCDTKAPLHWRRKSKEKRGRRRGFCIAHWQ